MRIIAKRCAGLNGRGTARSGLGSALFGVAASQGVFFYWYELTKGWFMARLERKLTSLDNLLVGALAGAVTAVATNPIWVVNTRVSVQKSDASSKNAWHTFLAIVREEGTLSQEAWLGPIPHAVRGAGPLALFNGLGPALALVSNPAIQFMVFERIKLIAERFRSSRNQTLGDFDFFLLGLISKFASSTITYPYILVKSRMQNAKKQSSDAGKPAPSSAEMLRDILATEGVKGLFRGYGPRISQSVLTAALLFLAKERLFNSAVMLLLYLQIKWHKLRSK